MKGHLNSHVAMIAMAYLLRTFLGAAGPEPLFSAHCLDYSNLWFCADQHRWSYQHNARSALVWVELLRYVDLKMDDIKIFPCTLKLKDIIWLPSRILLPALPRGIWTRVRVLQQLQERVLNPIGVLIYRYMFVPNFGTNEEIRCRLLSLFAASRPAMLR